MSQNPNLMATPLIDFFNPLTRDHWALLGKIRLQPILTNILQWIQTCPNMFWAYIEEEVMRTLQSQSSLPPPNSPFSPVVIPLSPNLAIVSPTTTLLPPLQTKTPHPHLRTGPVLSVAEAQGCLAALPSLENSLISLPFHGTEENTFLIQALPRVPCFRMTIRCHHHRHPTTRTFLFLLNPLAQELITPTLKDLRSGLGHQTNPFNPSEMKILVWNCRGDGSTSFHRNFLDMARRLIPAIAVIMETRYKHSILQP